MYASLYQLIQPHLEKPFDELPTEVKACVDKAFVQHSWDSVAPIRRSSLAQQYDSQRDPAMEEENQFWFDLQCEINEIERQIAEWTVMPDQGVPSEARIRDEKLTDLRRALGALKDQEKRPFSRGNEQPAIERPLGVAPSSSNSQLKTPSAKSEWVAKAKTLAARYIEKWRAAGYTPTVGDAAFYVEGEFSNGGILNTREEPIDRETIKREALVGATGRKPGERTGGKKIPPEKRQGLP